jgi:hypothetical protein
VLDFGIANGLRVVAGGLHNEQVPRRLHRNAGLPRKDTRTITAA